MRTAFIVSFVAPLTIIALAIPLILQKIPRNPFYGFRTRLTMSSDPIWYYANKISGIATLVAGVFWLLLVHILPGAMPDRAAIRLADLLGPAALVAGCAVSYVLTRRKFPRPS